MAYYDHIDYVEPVPLEDILVTGIARVEDLGTGLLRFWFYSEEHFLSDLRIIRARLVIPAERAFSIHSENGATFKKLYPRH